jgi:hypothetical protein
VTATDTPVAGPVQPEDAGDLPQRSSTARRAVLAAGGVVGFVGLVFLLYAASIHANVGDSDGSTVVLEGQALVHGHVLLHGWALSLDSFWTVDALVYAAAVAVAGLRPALLYAGPAIIAALVIVLGMIMAREGRRGATAIAGAVTVAALLAFPTHTMALFFLRGPLHVGTALWALIAFWAARRGRFGVGWAVAVLFLAAGMLGDLQMVAYGTVPIFLAGIVAMLRTRAWRPGIAQVSAAVASGVLLEVVRKVARALGSFTIGAANPIASRHIVPTNAKHVVSWGLELLGARTLTYGTGGVPAWLQDFHFVAAAVLGVTFLAALVALVRGVFGGVFTRGRAAAASTATANGPELWRLDDTLLIATFGPPVSFIGLALAVDPEYIRYLTVAVVFSSILAGRMVARYWPVLRWNWLAKSAAATGVAVTLAFVAGTGYTLAQPDPPAPAGHLAAWLEQNNLRNGLGDYWSSSITTLESKGQVTIRPIVAGQGSILHRYLKESDAAWYAGQRFQFFVYDTQLPWGYDNTISATKTWGPPAQTYDVGPYVVLTWGKPLIVNPNPQVS